MMDGLFVASQRVSRVKKAYRALILATCILAGPPAAQADNVDGAWSDLEDWPLIGLHAVLTPDGRVLTYGTNGDGQQTGYFIYDIWDPTAGLTGGHLTLNNMTQTDIFCSSQIILPTTGDVLITGGDNWTGSATTHFGNNNTNYFSPDDNSLVRSSDDMHRARWYASSTVLLNGEIYIQGGRGPDGDLPEVRQDDGSYRLLTGAPTSAYNYNYPRNFIAPDGRVFGYGADGNMYFVDPSGLGSLIGVGQFSSSVAGWTSSTAMFEPGRILQFGGNSTGTIVIDINGPTPRVTPGQSLSSRRMWVNATVLPDGKVLATGGSSVANQLTGVNKMAEIWDPETGTWHVGPEGAVARLYHSIALLLPDASVLVAAGGAPGPLTNTNAEIYYPPYLYDEAGDFAVRPQILNAPNSADVGDTLAIQVDTANISRVTLVKSGTVTHSFNMEQNFLELPFTEYTGNLLQADLPERTSDTPPGYYLMFVFDGDGVPSEAEFLRINIDPDPNTAVDYTPAIGAGGGSEYRLECFADEILVGVHGTHDAYINQIGPQCIAMDQLGRWIGDPVDRPVTGTTTGNTAFSETCPRDSAMSGFQGEADQDVNQLEIACRQLNPDGTLIGTPQYLGAVGQPGGTAQTPLSCATHHPVYALYGQVSNRLDSFGVECRPGSITQISVDSDPVIVNPGAQTGAVGQFVSLQIGASDGDGDVLTFSATGLPAGLSINTLSGEISGTPTVQGSFNPEITVSEVAANAATISYLGSDHVATWRSTSDLKVAAFDPDGDNAYGTDGYAIVDASTGNGAAMTLLDGTPAYISLTGQTGRKHSSSAYPDLDDATQPISGTVADLTTPGIAFYAANLDSPSISFSADASTDFILTVVNTHSNPPGTITVAGTGGTGGTADSPNDTAAGVRLHFFEVTGVSAGDTFTISATTHPTGTFHGIAFEAIPEPSTGTDTAAFEWTVSPALPLSIDPMPPQSPVLADAEVTYTASTSGGMNAVFKWQFGDGTPETAYSSSPSIAHTYSSPGIYFVTLTIDDDVEDFSIQTFVQTVHLPLTANAPARSSLVAYEDRPVGHGRLWVVNQDNQTVSVFDAVENTKISEVTVGDAPRSIAIAPDGRVWVSNKRSATLSIIGVSTHADAVTITDDFNVAHDYSGGNVAGTIWDGIRFNEGNSSGVVANANTTSPGELYFESANGNWSAGENDGLLLYKNVAGDFVADVQATSTTNGNYNGVGLMARLADPAADGDAGEDWMFLSYSTRFSQNRVRKVDNSSNTQVLAAGEQPFLQIERSGDDFIFRRKANAGDAWAQIDLVTRADLNGLPLQVGIWQADFDSTADSGTLDNFSLLTGANVGSDPETHVVVQTIALPFASQPYGIVFSPTDNEAYVVLEAANRLLKLDSFTGAELGSFDTAPHPRHIAIDASGTSVYVSQFITARQPGEETAIVQSESNGQETGGQFQVVDTASMALVGDVVLQHSDDEDSEFEGSGVPNYLGALAISPDGLSARVPSKKDNIGRGSLRSLNNLNFQNTVRAISSRIDLTTNTEDHAARIDYDDASLASAIAYGPNGVYAFAALETSREVAVVDAYANAELFRVDVGRAPQGLAISTDGDRLFVSNFMDRSVDVFDLSDLLTNGQWNLPKLASMQSVANETLTAQVLLGKQLFYDAADTRLARDRYMSCASCHNDGGQDGRVWDLTGLGEGLRNTISLRGRSGGQGLLHWSENFDEVHDFEGQIRVLAGGTGLMANADFFAGTRSEPLGDPKAGLSADLDALAAYVASLDTHAASPYRNSDGSLSLDGVAGRLVFREQNCLACHGGADFTDSSSNVLHDIGTLKASSGSRLGGALPGIDTPTLRGVWASAPYLHDGSAQTLEDAVAAHDGVSLDAAEMAYLVTYLNQIDGLEPAVPAEPIDSDGDGLSDDAELVAGTNPNDPDTDGDTVGDASDAFPNDPNETTDTDGDGLGDNAETGTGVYVSPTDTGTQANNADSDGDGISDGDEVSAGSDPNETNDPVAVSVSVPALTLLGLGVLAAVLVLMGSRAFAPQRE